LAPNYRDYDEMPPFDEAVVKQQIADGKIGGISLDTSIFDKLGRNLNSQPLLGLAQFRHGPTKFVLSEVVLGELTAHLANHANQAKQELVGKLKGIGTHWHCHIDIAAVEAFLGIDDDPSDFGDKFYVSFDEVVKPVIVGVSAVESTDLLRRYLAGDPPFGDTDAKKYEFPDALALISLEAWARNAKTIMLLVSVDGGWRKFCDQSGYLVCMDKLPSALDLFNEDDGVIVKRVMSMLEAGHAADLNKAIDAALESFFEYADIDVDAESHAHFEIDVVEPEVNSWRICDPDQADVIFADKETLVFSIPVHADVSFGIYFMFRAWDGFDRDYVSLGSRTIYVPKEIEVIMTISISRDIEPEPTIVEISSTPYRINFDLGHIDPFDC
jgi:hypothetical protein